MTSDYDEFRAEQRRTLEEDPEAFEFRADQDPDGIYWIIASRNGHGVLKIPLECASAYADRIRAQHPEVARHVDRCVEDGRSYAKDLHSISA